jgi:catechol 2,3-dioxygenase-like lactoylglutathione lyase family enzyme
VSGITDILYARFRVADLDQQARFLADFGLKAERRGPVLLARGSDPNHYIYLAEQGDPGFLGLGFEASSQSDLERIAKMDSAHVRELDLPGGGLAARLTDPDGNPVDVVFGAQRPEPLHLPSRAPFNFGGDNGRLGERVAFEPADAFVKRLGHCVLTVKDYAASLRWYQQRLGLIVSDEIYAGDEANVLGAFLRCDRGEKYVDHHTLFLLGTGSSGFNHAAFEVSDWDQLMLGHDRLRNNGYEHRWGVGKHLLGSQVFDYWKDPNGFTMEHFTDGDLFNASSGSERWPVDVALGSHWGPEGAP